MSTVAPTALSAVTSATVQGRELIEGRARLDIGEAAWLLALADFDTWGAWAEDGHSSCVAWLVDRCGMARRTAIEKLRVAKELDARPALAKAFAGGGLSYAKARAVSRYNGANPGVEDELIAAAAGLTNEQLERAVRYARGLHDQDRDPADAFDRRGVTRCHGVGGGMDRVIIDAPTEDIERLFNILDAYNDWLRRDKKNLRSGNANDDLRSGNANDGDAPPSEASPEDPAARASVIQRRYDALVDLIEHGATHHEQQGQLDPERALIGVTVDYDTLVAAATGRVDLASGAPITGEAVRRLACDAGIVRIVTRGQSQILDVGDKTRVWNRAQRRAIAARHDHRCAIKGCRRKIHQIHHIIHWTNDGPTDINNGVPLCYTHHHYVHEGRWQITWNPNTGITTLTGPAGQTIESHTHAHTPMTAAG